MTKTIPILGEEWETNTPYFDVLFIEEVPVSEFRKILQLKNLVHINASSYTITDDHLEIIGQFSKLGVLLLTCSEVTNNGIRFIEGLHNLHELKLKDNPQLTDQCVDSLVQLKALKMLHLGNTSITLTGVKQLLSHLVLESLILSWKFEDLLDELRSLSSQQPQLEIIVKGKATIVNGEIVNGWNL